MHLNVLQSSLPEFDIGPIRLGDNEAVCCFGFYWTVDVLLALDPHETRVECQYIMLQDLNEMITKAKQET